MTEGRVPVGADVVTPPLLDLVKLMHSYRHWQHFGLLSPELRARAFSGNQWRYETDAYGCGLGSGLPEGFRLPRLYRVKDLGDERLALALEDVHTVATPWDRARFARAARASRAAGGSVNPGRLPAGYRVARTW